VVTRRIASGGAAAAFATTADVNNAANHSSSQQPSRSQSLLQLNPFKRKKRRWLSNTSVATKLILFGSFCYCLVWMADILTPQSLETASNDGESSINASIIRDNSGNSRSVNNTKPGALDIRPDYLTDDGKADEEDEEEADTENNEEEDATEEGKEDATEEGKEDATKEGKEDATEEGKGYATEEGKEDATEEGKEEEEEKDADPKTDEKGQGEKEKTN